MEEIAKCTKLFSEDVTSNFYSNLAHKTETNTYIVDEPFDVICNIRICTNENIKNHPIFSVTEFEKCYFLLNEGEKLQLKSHSLRHTKYEYVFVKEPFASDCKEKISSTPEYTKTNVQGDMDYTGLAMDFFDGTGEVAGPQINLY